MKLELNTIKMRLAEETDAEFILSLRLDNRYNQFLSEVRPDVTAQREWIKNYKSDEADGKQYYFIIERLDGTPCGTVRVYDLRTDSFCWGSWILNDSKTRYAAVESALLVYEFGFDNLGYSKAHFDVMKGNTGVIAFHKRMGADITAEDATNIYFQITRESVSKSTKEMLKKLTAYDESKT